MSKLTIKDKNARLRTLNPNDDFAWAQVELAKEVERQHNAGEPVRIIVLKGRQLGISTFTEGLLFLWCFFYPGTNSLVMSKDRESSETLFEMTKLMWDLWPFHSLFSTSRSSVRRLSWNETLSNFRVESAKAREVARGTTLQGIHMSEVAFWEDAQSLTSSLMNAIPSGQHGTVIIIESTANGVGGWFYDEWMKAVRGESDFTPLFFPWFMHKEYSVRSSSLTEAKLTGTERTLQRNFNLSLGQLAWRRRKIREMDGNEDTFRQEYPCTAMESFLATGDNVFRLDALGECYYPPGSEYLGKKVGMSRGELVNDNGTIKFFKDGGGCLKVFKRPDPNKRMQYVVAADPSRTTYGDPGCVQVLNRTTMEQVAVWRGHAVDTDMAAVIEMLGYWYNTAVVNCEINGGGAGVIAILIHKRYPAMWRWRRPDRPLNKLGNVYGWSTNTMTKPWGIGTLQSYVVKRGITIHDSDTYLEMMEYTLIDGVEMGPPTASGTDDTVMALMVAVMTNVTEEPPDLSAMYGIDTTPHRPSDSGYGEDGYRELE